MSAKGSPQSALVCGVILVFAGLGVLFSMARWAIHEHRKQSWPTMTGTILECSPTLTGGKSISAPASSRTSHPVWVLTCRYRFSTGGKVWIGHRASNVEPRIHPLKAYSDQPPQSLVDICQSYPVGSEAAIHYNPADVMEVYLFYRSPLTEWSWCLVPTFLILLGLGCIKFAGIF